MKHLLVALCISPTLLPAQDIVGFLDVNRYFFVFDQGTVTKLEALPPRGFAMGGGYMAYASSNGDLKIYSKGKVRTIDKNIASMPVVTDHYFGYVTAGVFRLFDGDSLYMLCNTTGISVVEDSIAAWFDDRQYTLHIHYRGVSQQVGDALMENPIAKWRAGDNTLAWLDKPTSTFNIFYHGEIFTPATLVSDMRFDAGLDMVAFEDPLDHGLKVFYKGEVLDLEPVMPEKVVMGRGLFAYIDRSGALKVFKDGASTIALDFAPEEFFVRDSLVIIHDKIQMKVHHNGRTDMVLPYWPARWQASWGTLAWLDTDGSVKVWRDGNTTTALQRQPVKDLVLDRGLLLVNLKLNKAKVIWHGQVFDHP